MRALFEQRSRAAACWQGAREASELPANLCHRPIDMQGVRQVIAGVPQVGHYRRKIITQLGRVAARAVEHFFELADLFFKLPSCFGCSGVCQPFALLLKISPCSLGARVGASNFLS